MKNPNQKLLNEFTFNMVAFLESAEVVDREKRVIFLDGEFYHAEARFYLGRVAEFTAKDKMSDEILYYQHFDMTDYDTIYHHVNSFVHFLQIYRPGYRLPVEKKEKQQMEPLRILISCTSGMTSSYFAGLMQEKAAKISDRIRVEAADYMRLDEIHAKYDYILLAPQISHKLKDFQEKYGENRVMEMGIMEYASRDVEHVLENILSIHEKEQEKNLFRRLRKKAKNCIMKYKENHPAGCSVEFRQKHPVCL
ncbi:MAG: PTS sugar transporter subunit IIB [Lachnospiraceae bacterium]